MSKQILIHFPPTTTTTHQHPHRALTEQPSREKLFCFPLAQSHLRAHTRQQAHTNRASRTEETPDQRRPRIFTSPPQRVFQIYMRPFGKYSKFLCRTCCLTHNTIPFCLPIFGFYFTKCAIEIRSSRHQPTVSPTHER